MSYILIPVIIMMVTIPSVYIAVQLLKAVNTSYLTHLDVSEVSILIDKITNEIDLMEDAAIHGADVELELQSLNELRVELIKLVDILRK
jgi:hypothetical protein